MVVVSRSPPPFNHQAISVKSKFSNVTTLYLHHEAVVISESQDHFILSLLAKGSR